MKRLWKRWIAAAMAGLMMCMIGGVMPGDVQMNLGEPIVAEAYNWDLVDDYPQKYKDGALDAIIDEWRYYNRECTSFVAWRLNSRNGVDFYNYYGGVNFGDAGTWGSAARSIGITVDMNPAPGSVFWQQSGKYGHVAWVNTVNDDGTVTIEEYNWLIDNSYYDGAYHSRNVAVGSASGYIHIKDIDPTPKGHIMSEKEAAGQTIPDGDYYIYNALDCHYYMDLPARELESGDNVKMWNDENKLPGLHYAWTVTYRGNGFYKIKQKETNLCLDVEYGNLAKGTNVWIWKDDNSNEQQWSIERTETGYTITSRANAWCLDVEGYDGVTNGSNVHVWSDNGNPYQRWCFIPAEPKPIIEDGIYQIKSSKDTNYALSVGEVKDNFAKLELWDTAERSTYFKITHQEGGYYKLQELSSGSYLDLPDSDYMNVKNDFRINVDTDTRDKLYAFLPLYDGTYTIVSQYSGYAMDLLDGKVENGTTIRQFTYNSPTASPAERWILEKITPLDLVSGDVNANGTFNLVDLVLVQKWLHADPLTELTDPDAADMNQDGVIDIYDLALLKRKLLKLQTPDDESPHPTDSGFEQW